MSFHTSRGYEEQREVAARENASVNGAAAHNYMHQARNNISEVQVIVAAIEEERTTRDRTLALLRTHSEKSSRGLLSGGKEFARGRII